MTGGGETVAAVTTIVEESVDADEALRATVAALVEVGAAAWAGILFTDAGSLVSGPEAGTPAPDKRLQVPVDYEGTTVAELAADDFPDRAALERIAALIAAHCLVGWDTEGVPWDP